MPTSSFPIAQLWVNTTLKASRGSSIDAARSGLSRTPRITEIEARMLAELTGGDRARLLRMLRSCVRMLGGEH